jgi:hypothetical protein
MLSTDKYAEKVIDLDKILTLNFTSGATRPLVESGDNFMKMKEDKDKDIYHILVNKPFFGTKIRYKYEWEEILKQSFKYKKYHHITVNMDPSKPGYENEYITPQKEMIFDVIYEYKNKIKYLALIYERGRGKLHWHMLVNLQSVKEFEESLQKKFGKGRAVCVKKIQPNNNETLEDNLLRLLKYFQKEEQNKKWCLLSKT